MSNRDDPKARLTKQGPVLAALMALLRHRGTADHEDALMDAIVSVLQREVDEGDHVGAALSPVSARRYALRAVHNKLLDEWRSRARVVEFREQLARAEGEPHDNQPSDGELELIASALLAELTDPDRALLDAYFTSRDEYRSELENQGYTTTSARGRIYGLLKRLRNDGRRLRAPISPREP